MVTNAWKRECFILKHDSTHYTTVAPSARIAGANTCQKTAFAKHPFPYRNNFYRLILPLLSGLREGKPEQIKALQLQVIAEIYIVVCFMTRLKALLEDRGSFNVIAVPSTV